MTITAKSYADSNLISGDVWEQKNPLNIGSDRIIPSLIAYSSKDEELANMRI
jgi:hypothetical protein